MAKHERPLPYAHEDVKEPETSGFMITGKLYEFLKFVAQILLPALGTLYLTLAALWNLPSPEAVSGSVLAVDTFLGGVLHISSSNYKNSEEKFDGDLVVASKADGKKSATFQFNQDPAEWGDRTEVIFRVKSR